ncbi:MAG: lytic transglycosylase domain-containing protein [Clostridiales bacterium]
MTKSRKNNRYSKKQKKSKVGTFFILFILLSIFVLVAVCVFNTSERAYPRPHSYTVATYCNEYTVDSNLVYAIMKQESNFEPTAVSQKGALGLMQLMPETAQWCAGKIGIEYKEDKLDKPSYNLKISIWYISYLNSIFKNDTTKVIAAYNGGYGNVLSWVKDGVWDGTLADAHSIPFGETAHYVQAVSDNLKNYQKIYK